MSIKWRDGLEMGPDGECREMVQRLPVWTTTIWVTRDGAARRRYFNPILKIWTWDDTLMSVVENDECQLGIYTAPGYFVSLEHCIARAWLKLLPDSYPRAQVLPGRPIHKDYIEWQHEDSDTEEEEAEPGETWRQLKWRIGPVECPPTYKISSKGRLMNPRGRITSGFWFDGRYWAAVRNCGLVDLTTAARLRDNVVYLQPALKMAADALLTGHTPRDIATAAGISLETAWSYVTRCAQYLPVSQLRSHVPLLVSRDLWAALNEMKEDENPVLGMSLKDLMEELEEHLDETGEFFSSDKQYNQLRLARLCITANA